MGKASDNSFSILKKLIDIENLKFACIELQRIGAILGSHHYAVLGLLRSPLDWKNIKLFLFWIHAGKPYSLFLNIKKAILK
jgi:hypothetical protein